MAWNGLAGVNIAARREAAAAAQRSAWGGAENWEWGIGNGEFWKEGGAAGKQSKTAAPRDDQATGEDIRDKFCLGAGVGILTGGGG